MKKLLIALLFLTACSQQRRELTGPELIKKSIAYHDPKGSWENLKSVFKTRTTYADSSIAQRVIKIDLPRSYFSIKDSSATAVKTLSIEGDKCSFSLNGSGSYSEVEAEEHNLNCEAAKRNRDYYMYTLGLPMKLIDPGTNIHPEITKDSSGTDTELLKIKVTYNKEVGSDTWYFYVNPETYRMEMYRFYHDESANDGEYIILSDENVRFDGIKFPKSKTWYNNKGDKYLGQDFIDGVREFK